MEKYLIKFIEWTKLKIRIHFSTRIIYFREREVWWASLGINIGFEQDGKNKNFTRPILVFKKFNQDLLWALPLTSKLRNNKYYFQIEYNQRKYSVILSQLKLISSKRLIRKIRKISVVDYYNIKTAIKKLI